MLFVKATSTWDKAPSMLQPFIEQTSDGFQYTSNWQAISSVVAVSLLYYFLRDTSAKEAANAHTAIVVPREQLASVHMSN
jgi:hypothetical protein